MGPEGFGAEVVEGCGLVFVAHCVHGVDFVGVGWVGGFEGGVDDFGLDEGEEGFSRSDVDFLVGGFIFGG